MQAHPFTFEKNQVVHDNLSNKYYRILFVLPDQSICYWIDINSDSNIPKLFSAEDLSIKIATGAFDLVIDPQALKNSPELSEAMIRIQDERYLLIEDLVVSEPDIYDRTSRKALLDKTALEKGVSSNNLYRYLGMFWRGGMTKDALVPSFNHCGTAHKSNAPQQNRMGRPAKETDKYGNERAVFGKVLTEKDYENFEKAYQEYYIACGKKARFSRAYNRMKDELYVSFSPEDPNHPVALPSNQIPSFSQFRLWIKRNQNIVEDTKAQEGENRFELSHRGITGASEIGLFGPGAVAQIDATIADYYLVRKTDRSSVIGRPVLYFIRDVYSHIVIGMHITLENPSWDSALMALKNCVDDKVEYCKRYGIDITPETWPCNSMPYSITADNGEMKGTRAEDVVKKLGITVDNCPAYRGDLKGIIEKSFDTLNIRLMDITPGYVDKDQGIRGGKDYRREACLDLEQFTKIVIHCVLFYNNAHYMKDYEPTPEMRALNVPSVPRDLWNFGVRYATGAMKTVPKNDMLRVLLPRETATITERGISLHGLYYTCDKAEQENWFSAARIQGRSKVSVAFDPTCVDHIYLFDDYEGTQVCSLVGKSTRYAGITAEEADRREVENKTRYENYHAKYESQASTELHWQVKSVIEAAQQSGAAAAEIHKTLNKHNIRNERDEEKRDLSGANEAQKEQAIYFNSDCSEAKPAEDDAHDPVLDDITRALTDAGLL